LDSSPFIPTPRQIISQMSFLNSWLEKKRSASYLDLPIQHIDDEILRRMGRRARGREIRNLLQKIRTYLPEVSLRSSFIVGFPGETENQFKTLLNFVEEIQFDHLGAFKYSSEEERLPPDFLIPSQKV